MQPSLVDGGVDAFGGGGAFHVDGFGFVGVHAGIGHAQQPHHRIHRCLRAQRSDECFQHLREMNPAPGHAHGASARVVFSRARHSQPAALSPR